MIWKYRSYLNFVDVQAEQRHEHHLPLHHDRHRGRDHVGAVARHDEIDLVDVEQLGVDLRHRRRVGLVVVVDELDLAPEIPPLALTSSRQISIAISARLAVAGERPVSPMPKPILSGASAARARLSQKGEAAAIAPPAAAVCSTCRRVARDGLLLNVPVILASLYRRSLNRPSRIWGRCEPPRSSGRVFAAPDRGRSDLIPWSPGHLERRVKSVSVNLSSTMAA